jgi:hypothetical protein
LFYIRSMVDANYKPRLAPLRAHSRAIRRGSLGDLDGRSVEGRFLRLIEAELVEQLGGSPTFTQTLAIRRIARLALQAELFDQKMAAGDWTPHDSRTAAGINNAVLRALKDLGLRGRAEKPARSLKDYLSAKAAWRAPGEAAEC